METKRAESRAVQRLGGWGRVAELGCNPFDTPVPTSVGSRAAQENLGFRKLSQPGAAGVCVCRGSCEKEGGPPGAAR